MANSVTRAMHDVGLAVWFGGTLANAVALNGAVGEADPRTATAVTNAGWSRWTPVNAAAIGLHLIGGAGQTVGNKGRILGQQGVGTMTIVKTGLTGVALGVTAWSRYLGKKIDGAGNVPSVDATTPGAGTPPEVATAQRQLRVLQWAVPAITGALLVVGSYAGEQQRIGKVVSGVVHRIVG